MLGFEPETFCMRDRFSASEAWPFSSSAGMQCNRVHSLKLPFPTEKLTHILFSCNSWRFPGPTWTLVLLGWCMQLSCFCPSAQVALYLWRVGHFALPHKLWIPLGHVELQLLLVADGCVWDSSVSAGDTMHWCAREHKGSCTVAGFDLHRCMYLFTARQWV